MIHKERRFRESTNFSFSIALCNILSADAGKLGYIKHESINISGFLNRLIPTLSHYREDLHEKFLEYNGNDSKTAIAVERSLYNVYLKTFDLNDDGTINIPFRVNSASRSEFIHIHDCLLSKYDMDFTNYTRTLLNDYCSKNQAQRELFYYYDDIQLLKDSIHDKSECRFHLKDGDEVSFVPLFLEVTESDNYIGGITSDKKSVLSIKLIDIKNISDLDKPIKLEGSEYEDIYKRFLEIIKEGR